MGKTEVENEIMTEVEERKVMKIYGDIGMKLIDMLYLLEYFVDNKVIIEKRSYIKDFQENMWAVFDRKEGLNVSYKVAIEEAKNRLMLIEEEYNTFNYIKECMDMEYKLGIRENKE